MLVKQIFWRSQWWNDVWFSFGTNKSAGVVILKGKFKGRIHSKQTDTEGRWIILHVSIDLSQFIMFMPQVISRRIIFCF